jgi:putative transposase
MVTDGGTGLLAALPMVYPGTAVQRCWAHKSRNILASVRRADREAVTADLHTIQYTSGIREARMAIGALARRWHHTYPKAVESLRAGPSSDPKKCIFFNNFMVSLTLHVS